jgi:hypothetical protein
MKSINKIKTIYTYILAIVLIGMVSSCEKDATDVDIPKVNKELVMFSFLSPEEKDIEVSLEYSTPIFAPQSYSSVETDAIVTITGSDGTIDTIPFDNFARKYILSQSIFPIKGGLSYTITAKTNNTSVSGTTTVPTNTIQTVKLSYKQLSNNYTENGPYYSYNCVFKDVSNSKNYYRVTPETKIWFPSEFRDTMYSIVGNRLFNNQNQKGEEYNLTFEDNNYNTSSDKMSVKFHLMLTDVHYYEYHIRRLEYVGDDPFSEPTPQYSNNSNGFGVIGSYRITSPILDIK